MLVNLKKLAKKICVLGASALLTSSLSTVTPIKAVDPNAIQNTDGGTLLGQTAKVAISKGTITKANVTIPTSMFGNVSDYDTFLHDPFDASGGVKGITIEIQIDDSGNKKTIYQSDKIYGPADGKNKVKLYIKKMKKSNVSYPRADASSEWIEISSNMTDDAYKELFVKNPGEYEYYYYVDGGDFFNDISSQTATEPQP